MNTDNANLNNNLNQNNSDSVGAIVINKEAKKPIMSLEDFEKEIEREEKKEEKLRAKEEKNAEVSNETTPAIENKPADAPAVEETPAQEEKPADTPAVEETPAQEEKPADTPAVEATPAQKEKSADAPVVEATPAQEEKPADAPAVEETPAQKEKSADAPVVEATPAQEEKPADEPIETLDLGSNEGSEINKDNNTIEVLDLGNQESISEDNKEEKDKISDDTQIGDLDKLDESQLDDSFVQNSINNIVADHDEKTPENNQNTEKTENTEKVDKAENAEKIEKADGTVENKKEDFADVKGIAAIKKEELKESGYVQIGKTEKNLVLKIEKVKKKEIMDIIECFYETEKMSGNEKTIVNKYINEYIDVKYYNKNAFNGYSNFYENIRVCLIDFTKNLYKKADSAEEKNIIVKIANLFLLVNVLDSEDKFDINTRMINSKELKFENKSLIVKNLLKTFKYYDNVYDSFLKKLKSNVFTLQIDQIDKKCELYATNISSNLKFSDVYNHEVIEKAYAEEVAFENIKDVQFKLISIRICEEMLAFNFGRKYTIYLPESVYEKEKKLKSLLSSIDDLYSQNKVFIVITPDILKKYFKLIAKYKKEGYMFVLEIYSSYLSLITDMKLLFAAANYIVIVGENVNEEEINASIPKYLLDKILYTDKSINMGVICE